MIQLASEVVVSEGVIAIRIGLGDMPVLATPAILALMENAAMLAVQDKVEDLVINGNIYCMVSCFK